MKLAEAIKAAGVALALLVVNILIAILVIVFYSYFVDPGHPPEYYNKAALTIAPWSSHTAGTALFFGAGWLFGKRRPRRNALVFAVAFTILYVIIDAASVGFVGCFTVEFLASNAVKLVVAVAGAYLATNKTPAPQQ